MAEMLFRTQGEVMDYLHALGLKISRSKLSQDYRNGSLRCQADRTFLEADVLAYAETLKAPASEEKKDKIARLVRNWMPTSICSSDFSRPSPMPGHWKRASPNGWRGRGVKRTPTCEQRRKKPWGDFGRSRRALCRNASQNT